MPRLLIVDDDPEDRAWITEALSSSGYAVDACKNGTEAIEFYRRQRADLVFCDLMMPGIDGLSVLDAVKGMDPWATVVMVTGHSSVEMATRSLRLGAYDFVEKPFTNSKIQEVAARAMGHRKQLKQLALLQGRPGTVSDLPERLTELEQLKSDFLSLVAEGLRSPLRLLNETLSLIQNKQLLRQMRRIQTLLNRTLLGSLLQFLGHEQKIESSLVNLREILQDVLEEARCRCQEKHLIWNVELPEPAFKGLTDSKKVLSIASELLDNAIRFTPSEGAVTFRISPTAQGFRIEVSDTGCGMSAENRQQERQFSGQNCGVGLALVRHHLDLLRGTLHVTSAPGQGSCLRVDLPWWEKLTPQRQRNLVRNTRRDGRSQPRIFF